MENLVQGNNLFHRSNPALFEHQVVYVYGIN